MTQNPFTARDARNNMGNTQRNETTEFSGRPETTLRLHISQDPIPAGSALLLDTAPLPEQQALLKNVAILNPNAIPPSQMQNIATRFGLKFIPKI
jgi:hypothetical protein